MTSQPLLVPRATVMALVDRIDDAIERLLATDADGLDNDGVDALVDLLGIIDACASDQRPDGGGGSRFHTINGGLKRAA